MLTGAGLMAAILNEPGFSLPYHELYIYLARGFGSITCSWMNDSGLWIVGRLSGFTEKQTLATWTPMLTLIALVGLVQTMIMAQFFPLIPSVPAAAPGIEAAYVAPTPEPDASSRAFIASVDPL
jgi:GntP family gluconate:H+ symporter